MRLEYVCFVTPSGQHVDLSVFGALVLLHKVRALHMQVIDIGAEVLHP